MGHSEAGTVKGAEMKMCFILGLLLVFLNIFDLLIADIPYVHGNEISLIFGIVAMLLGAFIQ